MLRRQVLARATRLISRGQGEGDGVLEDGERRHSAAGAAVARGCGMSESSIGRGRGCGDGDA